MEEREQSATTGRSWQSQVIIWLIIFISLGFITWLVYYDRGTASGLVNLFYVPIIFAAFLLGDIGAIVTSVAAALCVGPWMPQMVRGGWAQPFQDIMVRTGLFYAVGILTSRFRAQVERREAELSSLFSVTQVITSSLHLDAVLRAIAQKAVELMAAKACMIRLLDSEGEELLFGASWGLSERYTSKGPVRVAESEIDRDALDGEAVAIPDVVTDPRFRYQQEAKQEGIVSVLCVPLRARESPLGVIRIYTARRRKFTRREHYLLWTFATQAAIAIENARFYERIRQNYFETVRALSRAIEAKDPYTLGHSERVTDLAIRMGHQLGLPPDQLETIRFGGILHDIGKIGVSEETLAREAERNLDDEVLVKLHPLIGRSILEPVEFLRQATEMVECHHEQFDGQGYPEGLAGEQIPILARLLAVANVYDHLTTEAPNRTALSAEEAINEIVSRSGTEFDPQMVEALQSVVERAEISSPSTGPTASE